MKARAARARKAILSALAAGASSASVAALAGGANMREYLTAVALAFVTGAIVYRVPNRPDDPAPTPPHLRV